MSRPSMGNEMGGVGFPDAYGTPTSKAIHSPAASRCVRATPAGANRVLTRVNKTASRPVPTNQKRSVEYDSIAHRPSDLD
jgi:hypothetical protein